MKKQKYKKASELKSCEQCEHCIHLGEGDYLCDFIGDVFDLFEDSYVQCQLCGCQDAQEV